MKALIRPGTARGTVQAPPSKSMAHRLLICAALAQGESVVRGVDPSEDILATADCLTALGASLSPDGTSVRVRGCDPRKAGPAVLRCRESGSTLRFMIPLCLLSGNPVRLEGSETLLSRPLSVYEDFCRETLELLIAEAAESFEFLPLEQDLPILRNILYSGVWQRWMIKTERLKQKEEAHAK